MGPVFQFSIEQTYENGVKNLTLCKKAKFLKCLPITGELNQWMTLHWWSKFVHPTVKVKLITLYKCLTCEKWGSRWSVRYDRPVWNSLSFVVTWCLRLHITHTSHFMSSLWCLYQPEPNEVMLLSNDQTCFRQHYFLLYGYYFYTCNQWCPCTQIQ